MSETRGCFLSARARAVAVVPLRRRRWNHDPSIKSGTIEGKKSLRDGSNNLGKVVFAGNWRIRFGLFRGWTGRDGKGNGSSLYWAGFLELVFVLYDALTEKALLRKKVMN